jgi:hypothetical protein
MGKVGQKSGTAQCIVSRPTFTSVYVEIRSGANASNIASPLTQIFKLRRLREYRITEVLKPEVQHQIDELLKNGFIRLSNSPMASPTVAVF